MSNPQGIASSSHRIQKSSSSPNLGLDRLRMEDQSQDLPWQRSVYRRKMMTINRTGLQTYFTTMRKEYERARELRKKRGRGVKKDFKNGDGEALLKSSVE
jgi:hypothetical protein